VLSQVILHARAAKEPGRAGLQRHRLAVERWFFTLETQSMAFFSTPGIDQLYSGETMRDRRRNGSRR